MMKTNVQTYNISQLQKIGTEMLRHVVRICEEEKINYCLFFGSMLGAVRHHGPIPWDYDIDIIVHENEMDRFVSAMDKKLPKEFWVDFRTKYDTPKCFPRIGVKGFDTHSLHIDVYRMVGFPESLIKSWLIVKAGRLLLEMRLVKNANLAYYTAKKKKRIQLFRSLLLPVNTGLIVKLFDTLCKMYPYEQSKKVGLNACKLGTKYIYEKKVIDDTILVDYEDFQVRIPRTYDTLLHSLYGDYMKFPDQDHIDRVMNKEYVIHKWGRK